MKPGFTVEQYRHSGATLRRAEWEVHKVLDALYRLYAVKSGEGARAIRQLEPIVQGDLLKARDNLAALMNSEYPGTCSDNGYCSRSQPLPRSEDWPDMTFRHIAFNKRVHRKTGFTMDDHRIAGIILSRVKCELSRQIVDISKAYASTTGFSGEAIKALCRVEKRINRARSKLEDIMAKEHRGEWSTHVYYGQHDQPDSNTVT